MTVTVKHTKISAVADGTDPNQVQPSDWNADHTLVGFTKLAGLDAMGAGLGLVTQTAADVFTTRSITGGTGIGITNPAGTAGNIVIAVTGSYQAANSKLTGLAAMGAGIGLVVQTALDTFTTRSLAAGTGIVITNPTGSAGNPTIALDTANPLTFTGAPTINITAAGTALQLISTDPGAGSGPNVDTYRDSSSPAANDSIGAFVWSGNNSAAARLQYGFILGLITDPTAGSEDFVIQFTTRVAGGNQNRWQMGAGLYYGPAGADTGAGRANVLGLDIAGTDIFTRLNTWSGNTNVFSGGSGTPVQLLFTDPGAGTGPVLQLYRNSSSPAAGDVGGSLAFYGMDSVAAQTLYAALYMEIADPTNGSEAGGLLFGTTIAGANIQPFRMRGGFYYAAGADPGSGRINVVDATGLQITGTSLFARANTWTAQNTFSNASGGMVIVVSGTAGAARGLQLQTAGSNRWQIIEDSTAEGGANAGSNFAIYAFADNGAFIASYLSINRATGLVSATNGMNVGGGATYTLNGVDIFARANIWSTTQTFTHASTGIALDSTAGNGRGIYWQTSGSTRWRWRMNNAEPGANAGGDLQLDALTDAAAALVTPMQFTRATGAVVFNSIGASTTNVALVTTDDGAAGTILNSLHITASPAASDSPFTLQVNGRSSTGVTRNLAQIVVLFDDPTNASEDARFVFQTMIAGAMANRWAIKTGFYYAGGIDPGAGIANVQGLQISGTDIFARANTWTGANTFGSGAGSVTVAINGGAGGNRLIELQSGGVGRWKIFADTSAESTGNLGSNFNINAYSDAGALLGPAINIIRATGDISFTLGANFNFGSTSVASATTIAIRAPAGQYRQLAFYSGSSQRWNINANNGAESGSNAGSDLNISAYTDAGAFIGVAVLIARGTMKVTFAGDVIVNGSALQANDCDIVTNASGANHGFIRIQSATGTIHGIAFRSGTNATSTGDRWRIYGGDAVAESGANVGANFLLASFTDTGTSLHNLLNIARSTGNIQIGLNGGGVIVGNPTGGFKGNGTVNAVGVYDDNVLLTCYVLEAANNNFIDFERWDSFNYGRPHAPARKFATRTHVLDVDKYIAEWKETGVLPGMPSPEAWAEAGGMSTGDMIQRLWETVELLAVHIDTVNTRALAA